MGEISKDSLKRLTTLAAMLRRAEDDVAKAMLDLKAKAETARLLREEDIPALMSELSLTKIVLDTGEIISVVDEVYASITVAKRAEAFAWLEQAGHGGLIKTSVEAAFGKGEFEKAKALAQQLQGNGFTIALSQDVHAQTLKAFIKEQLAAGKEIPLELFGARPVKTAKLKAPKLKE